MAIQPAPAAAHDAWEITDALRREIAHGINLCRVIETLPYGERSVLARLTREAKAARKRREELAGG